MTNYTRRDALAILVYPFVDSDDSPSVTEAYLEGGITVRLTTGKIVSGHSAEVVDELIVNKIKGAITDLEETLKEIEDEQNS